MLTKTQEDILVFLLKNKDEHNTIRGIAKKLKKSYTLVYNNISKLEKNKIIKKTNVPPAQIVSLNEFAPQELLINIELKIKNNFLNRFTWVKLMLKDLLSNLDNPFFILLVFGSYAKGKQTNRSDIDLLVITPSNEDIKRIESFTHEVYTKVKKSIIVVSIEHFLDMISNTNSFNVGNEARNHHILLHGAEHYYSIISRRNL